ncbi:MAG: LPS export ABC transporter periplasmic protein LptC [Bilophila sp.]
MKRARILLLLVVGVALVAGVWYTVKRPASLLDKALELASKSGITSLDGSKVQGNATSANPLEEVVGLAIKNINLFQGNKGVELWRLNASWAHLSQNGDTIDVDKPVIRYALGDDSVSKADSDVLNVKADKGRITDNQRFLSLWDNVLVTRYDDTLTGSRMNYDAPTRTMVFPEGAVLESPTASGTAKIFTWDLAKNELYGTNGVLVVLKPRPPKEQTADVAPVAKTPSKKHQKAADTPKKAVQKARKDKNVDKNAHPKRSQTNATKHTSLGN